jgi:hypothetical protein
MTSSPKPAAPRKWKTASAMKARRHLTPGQRALVVAMTILKVVGLGDVARKPPEPMGFLW